MLFSMTLEKNSMLKHLEEISPSIVVAPLTWFSCSYPGPRSNYFVANLDERDEEELNTE